MFAEQLASWGYGRASHETERDFALAVGRALGGAAPAAMESAVERVEDVCYGGRVLEPNELAQLERWLLSVLRSVGRRLGRSLASLPGRHGWLAGRKRIVS